MKPFRRLATFVTAGLVMTMPLTASAQTWTSWNSANPGVFNGTLLGTAVTFLGAWAGGSNLSGDGTDFFNPTNPYTQGGLTAPDVGGNTGFIKLIDPTAATITFSTPMTNLYLAFISVGSMDTPVTYTFDHAFTVLSNNNCPTPSFWGCGTYSTSGNSITGTEFSGTIQFIGTFDELTLTTNPSEDWHGFTFGADAVGAPEPATLSLCATGLLVLTGAARLRRKLAA